MKLSFLVASSLLVPCSAWAQQVPAQPAGATPTTVAGVAKATSVADQPLLDKTSQVSKALATLSLAQGAKEGAAVTALGEAKARLDKVNALLTAPMTFSLGQEQRSSHLVADEIKASRVWCEQALNIAPANQQLSLVVQQLKDLEMVANARVEAQKLPPSTRSKEQILASTQAFLDESQRLSTEAAKKSALLQEQADKRQSDFAQLQLRVQQSEKNRPPLEQELADIEKSKREMEAMATLEANSAPLEEAMRNQQRLFDVYMGKAMKLADLVDERDKIKDKNSEEFKRKQQDVGIAKQEKLSADQDYKKAVARAKALMPPTEEGMLKVGSLGRTHGRMAFAGFFPVDTPTQIEAYHQAYLDAADARNKAIDAVNAAVAEEARQKAIVDQLVPPKEVEDTRAALNAALLDYAAKLAAERAAQEAKKQPDADYAKVGPGLEAALTAAKTAATNAAEALTAAKDKLSKAKTALAQIPFCVAPSVFRAAETAIATAQQGVTDAQTQSTLADANKEKAQLELDTAQAPSKAALQRLLKAEQDSAAAKVVRDAAQAKVDAMNVKRKPYTDAFFAKGRANAAATEAEERATTAFNEWQLSKQRDNGAIDV